MCSIFAGEGGIMRLKIGLQKYVMLTKAKTVEVRFIFVFGEIQVGKVSYILWHSAMTKKNTQQISFWAKVG